MSDSKRCPLCEAVKPLEDFARAPHRRDGRVSYCKPCARMKYHEPIRARNRLVARPTEGEQDCRVCRQRRPLSDFHWKADQARHATECKPCRRDRDRRSWAAGGRRAQRTKQLREKYGITDEEYAALLAAQGGACAICGDTPTTDRALAVDHDHATGERRSLLCGRCNPGLGLFLDDPRLLRLAALYLEQHSGVGT